MFSPPAFIKVAHKESEKDKTKSDIGKRNLPEVPQSFSDYVSPASKVPCHVDGIAFGVNFWKSLFLRRKNWGLCEIMAKSWQMVLVVATMKH